MRLHTAAELADRSGVVRALGRGEDPDAVDAHGWTALHRAAAASEASAEAATVVIEALVDAGATVDLLTADGRTALYLAAEFSPSIGPLEALIAAGANPDVSDEYGNHITENADAAVVVEYLAELTGRAVPATVQPVRFERRLTPAEWKAAERQIAAIFEQLEDRGYVTAADAGTTQSDGFDDCTAIVHARGLGATEIVGFCFYTRQDSSRARATGHLDLAFWGAPDGGAAVMLEAGHGVVAACAEAGFDVEWDGSLSSRPSINLLPAS
ncbi:hypothetical protein ASE14_01805 [Agromyces sp. Root81]|uniref:ankyrin repeat domain-containing protein n=1 Tax=Agromyces sp. Root81 TaxID=1736601 RepID=UPI0006F74FF6|nr:ankyrin repeat domain-containing protein [Agromyces sp. Root81]KRC62589.1 hypothetical protein ASE14_01805 [Agromyces sp. Root81]